MTTTQEFFEICLSDSVHLQGTGDGTRSASSTVLPDAGVRSFPTAASNNLDELYTAMTVWRSGVVADTSKINRFFRALCCKQDSASDYSFVWTPKLRENHTSLIVEDFDRGLPHRRQLAEHTANIFDLVMTQSFNPGSMHILLDYVASYERQVADVLRDSVISTRLKHRRVYGHGSNEESEVVLSDIIISRMAHHSLCAAKGVRNLAILMHNVQINGCWHDIGVYMDIVPKGPQSKRLFSVDNPSWLPVISFQPKDARARFFHKAKQEAQQLADEDSLNHATDGSILTLAGSSLLPNSERSWSEVKCATRVPSSWVTEHEYQDTLNNDGRRVKSKQLHERLRQEAQAFAQRICTEETLDRAWNYRTRNLPYHEVVEKELIRHFVTAVRMLGEIVADEEEWAAVDRSKAYPRIDRLARAWALAKIESQEGFICRGNRRGDVKGIGDDTVLEETVWLRLTGEGMTRT